MASWPEITGLRFAALALFIVIAIASIWMLHKRWRSAVMALVVVGLSGVLVYALNPNWSYASVIDRAVQGDRDRDAWMLEAGAIALFVGASISALLRQRFVFIAMTAKASFLCAIGGFLMGLGARLVPGGNDTLMLWSIPGLTRYGIVAYAVIIATIALFLVAHRALSQQKPA